MSTLQTFLSGTAELTAPKLLGCRLTREYRGHQLIGRIVETEAYDQHDAASHSYRGRTPRTDVMFGPAGHLYVYFTYGMHYCCNIVTGEEGEGSAVLIRAVEPLWHDMDSTSRRILAQNRGQAVGSTKLLAAKYLSDMVNSGDVTNLTNGPAKFCQAFGIDKSLNGHDLRRSPLILQLPEKPLPPADIVQTTRIGIREAREKPWRFFIRGNPYVSKI